MIERLLIVGLGSIGRRHARMAREIAPDARIVVLRHRAVDEALPSGIERAVTTIDDALAFAPQAAVIASPASHHLDAALPLARAGVHLLVEKPIAAHSRDVPELIAAAAERGTTLLVGYNLRFLPSLNRFRELLRDGRIGTVLSVRAEVGQYLPTWRPTQDYRTTVSAQASLGGGALLELSHELDYLRWVFGDVQWVRAVQAKVSDLEIDVEDVAHLLLGFAGAGGGNGPIASVSLDVLRHDTTRACIAIGSEGTLRWNAIAGTVDVFERGAKVWQELVAGVDRPEESYRAEWRHFLACVAGSERPLTPGADGLAVLRVIEAARQSSAGAGSVPVSA